MVSLSDSIQFQRKKNNYTQDQLAILCRVTGQTVNNWEHGTARPDIDAIIRLANIFGISTDELLTGKQPSSELTSMIVTNNHYVEDEKLVNTALKEAMSHEDPDEEISQFLASIGGRIGCDRMYVFESNLDGSFRNTYEWCDRGIRPQIDYLQDVPSEDLSLWLDTFSRGGYIFIENIEEIRDSDPAVYRWLKPQDIHSLMVHPLLGGRGFIGVDNPAAAFVSQTSSLIEIMIHFTEVMLQRRDLMRKLKWAEFQNDQFNNISSGIRYQINLVTGKILFDETKAEKDGYPTNISNMNQLEEFISSHPEFRDHLQLDGIQKAIQLKKNISLEFISYKSSGEVRWNRLLISPFVDGSDTVLQLYGVLQDTSDRHPMIEQYNKYISHLSGGIHVCYLSNPVHLDYASDNLCDFTGYSREEFEQVIGDKYARLIADEDRTIFSGYVRNLASAPGSESCEYRIRKKDGSIARVIDMMESVADSTGAVYGYAFIFDRNDLTAMLDMVEKKGRRQLAVIDRQYEVLEAMGRDYLNIFRVWLDDDKAQIVQMKGYVTKGLNKDSSDCFPYYRFCMQYIQDRVHPDDREMMLKAMHPDIVRKALLADDRYLVVYRISDKGGTHFYQFKYTRLSTADSNKINFVAGFKNVDKVVENERLQKEQLKNRLDMITAILQAFNYGYYYSYADNTFTELLNVDFSVAEITGKHGDFTECRKQMALLFPDQNAYKVIDAYIDPKTFAKRLNGDKYLSQQIQINSLGWYEMYMFPVDYDAQGNIAHYIFAARDITQSKLQNQALEIKLKDAQVKNSIHQMQPHFLYNALSSIREIVLDDPQAAYDLIYDFSTYLRACIKAMQASDVIPFTRELDNIKAYVNIERMRFGSRLRVIYDIKDENIMILPLSLQPIIENSIRHGIFERGAAGGTVELKTELKDGSHVITISDDGVGFDYEEFQRKVANHETESVGLTNLIFRLENMLKAKVNVVSVIDEGTTVTISIPVSQ